MRVTPEQNPAKAPSERLLAQGGGWTVHDYVCVSGPEDKPFEEQHDGFSIAAVIEGSFNYASAAGRALLHPGALLLGNHGTCFECGHDHGVGDRCVSVKLDSGFFQEIAASVGGGAGFRFPVAMLSANRDFLPGQLSLEIGTGGDPMELEEKLIAFTAAAIRALSGAVPDPAKVSAQDERRISRALRHIERHADEALDLDQLAAAAAMSKFHFLRVFRRAIGMTPYQFLLNIRFRRAALRLLTTPTPIAAIAFESGFGDLSTFNHQFRDRFGASPAAFRRQGTA